MDTSPRILAIDAFRAVTMLLMIWVNDFWSLSEVPHWLEHMPGNVDALGFSDVIFPAFLFIVGLSIPFAQQARLAKGDSRLLLFKHIAIRSGALLLMGVLMVNLENYDNDAALLSRSVWQVLMIAAFFLIWNRYPRSSTLSRIVPWLKGLGIGILIAIAAAFRSSPDNGYNWLEPHWWGILGLIGWSYLIAASLQLLSRNRLSWVATAWVAFTLLTPLDLLHFFDWMYPVRDYIWISSSGALPTLTLAGCLASTLYLNRRPSTKQGSNKRAFLLLLIAFGVFTLILGFALRPYWGISKINATPAWVHICTGISLLCYALLYWIVDTQNKKSWIAIIAPAGTATLTCYLVPYLAYPAMSLFGISLPAVLTTGWIGLAQSLLFAFVIVWITGGLNKCGIKLKL